MRTYLRYIHIILTTVDHTCEKINHTYVITVNYTCDIRYSCMLAININILVTFDHTCENTLHTCDAFTYLRNSINILVNFRETILAKIIRTYLRKSFTSMTQYRKYGVFPCDVQRALPGSDPQVPGRLIPCRSL